MNFLSLCKRLRQEAGYSGSGPSSVTNQAGESKRVVDWINDAWLDIQGMRSDWRFMLEPFSVSLVSGESSVSVSALAKELNPSSVVLTRADGSKSWPSILKPEVMRLLMRENEDVPGYPFYLSLDAED